MINYLIIFTIIILSLYAVANSISYFKKIIALTIMQNAIWLFFISIAYAREGEVILANPLPHTLILTAIVVGISTLAIAIALLIRVKNER